uniref:Uncharacterized protein n=1 Tax=Onchocerca volvulus TaxID=6282 RepID=A0A8R1U2J7_ONCVO
MRSYPILKRLTQYFGTLNNKDLLSVRGTCKSFHGLASKLLNIRNKPLIITNGTISDTVGHQISSTYEEDDTNDFLELRRWQPEIALLFDDCNNPTPIQYMPFDCLYLQIIPYDNCFNIFLNFPSGGMLGNNHPRSGVIIPKMYDAFTNFIVLTNEGASLFLVFGGSNVEASTFLVETTNEEKLREKLLKWKPATLRLSASELAETGLIHCNSTSKLRGIQAPRMR